MTEAGMLVGLGIGFYVFVRVVCYYLMEEEESVEDSYWWRRKQ